MHEHSSNTGIDAAPLLELMTQQADAQARDITAAATEGAARILEQAQQESAAQRERALRAAEAELSAAAQRGRERAEAEAHMLVLTTKDAIVSEILGNAQAELQKAATGPEFPAVLASLLEEVLADAPAGAVVLAPPAHVDTVQSWLQANGRGEHPVQPLSGLNDGVAIQDAGQTFRVTNTLSSRYKRQESALRKYSLQQLFGGEN